MVCTKGGGEGGRNLRWVLEKPRTEGHIRCEERGVEGGSQVSTGAAGLTDGGAICGDAPHGEDWLGAIGEVQR